MKLNVNITALADLAREVSKGDEIEVHASESYDLMAAHVVEWIEQSEDPMLMLAATCVHLLVENQWLNYERLE